MRSNRKNPAILISFFAVILALCLLAGSAPANTGKALLRLELSGFRNELGSARVALHSTAETFPNDHPHAFMRTLTKIEDGRAKVEFADVPYGAYAVAVMHDENDNDEFDYNIVGIPKEGFGVSNNVRHTFRPPRFDEARFELEQPALTLQIEMFYY